MEQITSPSPIPTFSASHASPVGAPRSSKEGSLGSIHSVRNSSGRGAPLPISSTPRLEPISRIEEDVAALSGPGGIAEVRFVDTGMSKASIDLLKQWREEAEKDLHEILPETSTHSKNMQSFYRGLKNFDVIAVESLTEIAIINRALKQRSPALPPIDVEFLRKDILAHLARKAGRLIRREDSRGRSLTASARCGGLGAKIRRAARNIKGKVLLNRLKIAFFHSDPWKDRWLPAMSRHFATELMKDVSEKKSPDIGDVEVDKSQISLQDWCDTLFKRKEKSSSFKPLIEHFRGALYLLHEAPPVSIAAHTGIASLPNTAEVFALAATGDSGSASSEREEDGSDAVSTVSREPDVQQKPQSESSDSQFEWMNALPAEIQRWLTTSDLSEASDSEPGVEPPMESRSLEIAPFNFDVVKHSVLRPSRSVTQKEEMMRLDLSMRAESMASASLSDDEGYGSPQRSNAPVALWSMETQTEANETILSLSKETQTVHEPVRLHSIHTQTEIRSGWEPSMGGDSVFFNWAMRNMDGGHLDEPGRADNGGDDDWAVSRRDDLRGSNLRGSHGGHFPGANTAVLAAAPALALAGFPDVPEKYELVSPGLVLASERQRLASESNALHSKNVASGFPFDPASDSRPWLLSEPEDAGSEDEETFVAAPPGAEQAMESGSTSSADEGRASGEVSPGWRRPLLSILEEPQTQSEDESLSSHGALMMDETFPTDPPEEEPAAMSDSSLDTPPASPQAGTPRQTPKLPAQLWRSPPVVDPLATGVRGPFPSPKSPSTSSNSADALENFPAEPGSPWRQSLFRASRSDSAAGASASQPRGEKTSYSKSQRDNAKEWAELRSLERSTVQAGQENSASPESGMTLAMSAGSSEGVAALPSSVRETRALRRDNPNRRRLTRIGLFETPPGCGTTGATTSAASALRARSVRQAPPSPEF